MNYQQPNNFTFKPPFSQEKLNQILEQVEATDRETLRTVAMHLGGFFTVNTIQEMKKELIEKYGEQKIEDLISQIRALVYGNAPTPSQIVGTNGYQFVNTVRNSFDEIQEKAFCSAMNKVVSSFFEKLPKLLASENFSKDHLQLTVPFSEITLDGCRYTGPGLLALFEPIAQFALDSNRAPVPVMGGSSWLILGWRKYVDLIDRMITMMLCIATNDYTICFPHAAVTTAVDKEQAVVTLTLSVSIHPTIVHIPDLDNTIDSVIRGVRDSVDGEAKTRIKNTYMPLTNLASVGIQVSPTSPIYPNIPPYMGCNQPWSNPSIGTI